MDIDFNKEWAKSVTKKQFVDAQKHFTKDCDLEAEYDKIVPPKENKSSEKGDKEPEKE
jgi:hypothetical protein